MQRLLVVLFGLLAFSAYAEPGFMVGERCIAGTHYEIVCDAKAPKPDKPSVVEFFSYGCPHCEHLEPHLLKWIEKNQDRVTFSRVPAQWNAYFRTLAKLYLVLDKMGVAEQKSAKVFEYIHKKHKPLRKESEVLAFAEKELGIDAAAFKLAWESDDVKSQLNKAGKALRVFKISGVPALVVNDRYQVSVKLAGSEEAVFDVVDFLLTK